MLYAAFIIIIPQPIPTCIPEYRNQLMRAVKSCQVLPSAAKHKDSHNVFFEQGFCRIQQSFPSDCNRKGKLNNHLGEGFTIANILADWIKYPFWY